MRHLILPCRGEFGLKICYHVPAVRAFVDANPDTVVMHEEGEESLYPYPNVCRVTRQHDSLRAGLRERTPEDIRSRIDWLKDHLGGPVIEVEIDHSDEWPKKYFVPDPKHDRVEPSASVVLCPRGRAYGRGKNWPHWTALAGELRELGVTVAAAGAPDSSLEMPGWVPRAWDYQRFLDASIRMMLDADLVIATDAGLAHLAIMCGRPLLMITHGEGLVAPGPVIDSTGKVAHEKYWPVKIERYYRANHCDAPITIHHHGWSGDNPARDIAHRASWLLDCWRTRN